MRRLKFILIITYPILIILLIILNLRSCHWINVLNNGHDSIISDTTIVAEESADSTIVQQVREIGGSGELKVTLLWNFQGDIDLHVLQPNGRTIYYKEPRDGTTGGFLDVDNRCGGDGSTENIYWENPPHGKYTISLVYYQPSERTNVAESGECVIVVIQEGQEAKKYVVRMNRVDERRTIATLNV